MKLPSNLTQLTQVIIDSYFIIDNDFNIVDFNRAFHSMLSRSVARKLKTSKCYEVLQLDICREGCIAKQCWQANRSMRLDEISGRVAGDEQELRFILSAIPIYDDEGAVIGALEMQRNVTDEALVQTKYQRQMEESSKQQRQLAEELQSRTKRLLTVSRRLYDVQRELVHRKTSLLG